MDPRQGGDPADARLAERHGVGQRGRPLVKHQRHAVARDRRPIEEARDARQDRRELGRIGDIAWIDVRAEAQAPLPIQEIGQPDLPQIVTACLLCPRCARRLRVFVLAMYV